MPEYLELDGRGYVWRQFLPLNVDRQDRAESPRAWRLRGEEVRALAAGMTDHASKHTMLRIAEGYDHLAKRVEERSARATAGQIEAAPPL
jgi:hypothetical protein